MDWVCKISCSLLLMSMLLGRVGKGLLDNGHGYALSVCAMLLLVERVDWVCKMSWFFFAGAVAVGECWVGKNWQAGRGRSDMVLLLTCLEE